MSILILFAALYNSWYVVLLQLYTPVSLLTGIADITVYILADSFLVYLSFNPRPKTEQMFCSVEAIALSLCPNTEKYKGAI